MTDTQRAATAEQIKTAYDYGLVNVRPLAAAARAAGMSFATACALVEGESPAPDMDHPNGGRVKGGANIYGHDVRGTFSTRDSSLVLQGVTYPRGSSVPVTASNAGIFLIRIGAGAHSNGMGPGQLTYAGELPDGRSGGYFRIMLEQRLLPWDPEDSLTFLLRELHDQLKAAGGNLAAAGAHYNGGTHPGGAAIGYGQRLLQRDREWRERLG